MLFWSALIVDRRVVSLGRWTRWQGEVERLERWESGEVGKVVGW